MVWRLRTVGFLLLAVAGVAIAINWPLVARAPVTSSQDKQAYEILSASPERIAFEARYILSDGMGDDVRKALGRLLRLDFILALTYAMALVGLSLLLRACPWPGARVLGTVAALAAIGASAADFVENTCLLNLLGKAHAKASVLPDEDQEGSSVAEFVLPAASFIKFGLLFAFGLAITPLFLAYARLEWIPGWLATLTAVGLLQATLLGMVGLSWNVPAVWALPGVVVALVASASLFIFYPRRFAAGTGLVRPIVTYKTEIHDAH